MQPLYGGFGLGSACVSSVRGQVGLSKLCQITIFPKYVFPTPVIDKCALPMFVYTLITKLFFLTSYIVFLLFLLLDYVTFPKFRSLKCASVYVTVPFQSASELSSLPGPSQE